MDCRLRQNVVHHTEGASWPVAFGAKRRWPCFAGRYLLVELNGCLLHDTLDRRQLPLWLPRQLNPADCDGAILGNHDLAVQVVLALDGQREPAPLLLYTARRA